MLDGEKPRLDIGSCLLSIYRTWSADLTDQLDEIDREAIRCGRRKYVVLEEAEKRFQALVAFWGDCGLVTGQRTPPHHGGKMNDWMRSIQGLVIIPTRLKSYE